MTTAGTALIVLRSVCLMRQQLVKWSVVEPTWLLISNREASLGADMRGWKTSCRKAGEDEKSWSQLGWKKDINLIFSFSWNENPKEDLKSYFSWLEELSYEVDPLWTEGPDSSPVDRKNVKLLSGIEKNERSVYEAVLNLNGQKEAIVRVFSGVGSGGRALGQFMKVPG